MATQKKPAKKHTEKKAPPPKSPIRREIGAAVCFFLAFFSFLAMSGLDAPVLTAIAVFGRWLVGWGFYVLPFALLAATKYAWVPLSLCIWALVVWKHKENIARLRAGTEKSWLKSRQK